MLYVPSFYDENNQIFQHFLPLVDSRRIAPTHAAARCSQQPILFFCLFKYVQNLTTWGIQLKAPMLIQVE